jgi:hypothetical protein
MQVLHVFEEDDRERQELHMEHWFGFPDASPIFIFADTSMVCYCGGKLVPLKRNPKDASDIKVGIVWHLAEWVDDQFFPEKSANE